MKTPQPLHILPLLGGLALAACQDGGPSAPALEDLSLEDQITLELLSDPTFTETALDLVGTQTAAAHRRGRAWRSGEGYALQAAVHFQGAQAALAQGNTQRALERARVGRELIAEGIEAVGGPWAIEGMVERLESLPLAINGDPDCYQDPQGLGVRMGELARGARNAFRKGKRIQAGQLGVLGEQAVRQRIRDGSHSLSGRPEVWVELGGAAVDLATGILGAGTPDQEQLDLLAAAGEYQTLATEALAAGDRGRAVHFAHMAQWWSLKAVVIPGGISDEEVALILDLAKTLLADATAAVGSEPTDLEAALLAKATTMLGMGEGSVANGTCRGLGALWQVALIGTYLIG